MRHSYGIALCRLRPNGTPEILLVKKRFSYEFHEFVLGKYKKHDQRDLAALFNGMTIQEKLDIIGLDFSAIWYRLWAEIPAAQALNEDNPREIYVRRQKYSRTRHTASPLRQNCIVASYVKNRSKFESLLADNTKMLLHLINNSTNAGTIWEIPKGHCERREMPLDAAIREFTEETNVRQHQYNILWSLPPISMTYTDEHIIYHYQYYIAEATPLDENGQPRPAWVPKIPFELYKNKQEVEYARWVALHEIPYLQMAPAAEKRLLSLARQAFRRFRHGRI